jgi:hypothetical protein
MRLFLLIFFTLVLAKLEHKNLVQFIENRSEIMESAQPRKKKSLEEQIYEAWGPEAVEKLSS